MTDVDHERFRDWDASYVLGALTTEDRLAYERHLDSCALCREAVAELAGLPGLMGRLGAEDAVATVDAVPVAVTDGSAASGGSLRDVARRVRVRRRRRRIVAIASSAAAVALAVVLGFGLGGTIGSGGSGGSPGSGGPVTSAAGQTYTMRPVGQSIGLSAQIEVTRTNWGTRFDWSCRYGAPGANDADSPEYDLVVTRRDGTTTTVATWGGAGDRGVDASGLAAATGIPLSSIASVEIRLHDNSGALLRTSL